MRESRTSSSMSGVEETGSMEDLGEQEGRKPACAIGSDLPSGYRASRRLYVRHEGAPF